MPLSLLLSASICVHLRLKFLTLVKTVTVLEVQSPALVRFAASARNLNRRCTQMDADRRCGTGAGWHHRRDCKALIGWLGCSTRTLGRLAVSPLEMALRHLLSASISVHLRLNFLTLVKTVTVSKVQSPALVGSRRPLEILTAGIRKWTQIEGLRRWRRCGAPASPWQFD